MFYKMIENELVVTDKVTTPQGELTKDFLMDGWVYADTSDEALKIIQAKPTILTARQTRLALLQLGLLSQIEEAITTMPKEVQIEWEYATEIHRYNPLIVQIGNSFGLTEKQLDDLFILGITL